MFMKQQRMYCRSGTGERCCCVCSFIRRQHFYVWNDVMDAILKVWRRTSNWKSDSVKSMCIQFSWGTILPNFTPIWFKITQTGFLRRSPSTRKRKKMNIDMRPVPDVKVGQFW